MHLMPQRKSRKKKHKMISNKNWKAKTCFAILLCLTERSRYIDLMSSNRRIKQGRNQRSCQRQYYIHLSDKYKLDERYSYQISTGS